MTSHRETRRFRKLCRRPQIETLEDRRLLDASTPHFDVLPVQAAPTPAESSPSSPSVTPVGEITGSTATRSLYDVDGAGLSAAVIDTGVNYRHEALGGGFGPGYVVKAGYDFGDGDGDPFASTWQHGTSVAGLIASRDPARSGIAPGADVVALRVFNSENQGDFSRIGDALQWVIDHHDEHDISVVNLSISDGRNYLPPFLPYSADVDRIRALVQQLAALDIPVVTAAGNSFTGLQGMGFTAIVPETISVTGSDASDELASNAQRLGTSQGGSWATDLVAPGVGLEAPGDDNSFVIAEGTSFSAPIVSGAILLLQEIYQSRFGVLPAVSDLMRWLKAGAEPIRDAVTGITLGRLDVERSAGLIPAAPTSEPTPPVEETPPPAPVPAPADPPSPPAREDPPAQEILPEPPAPAPIPEAPPVVEEAPVDPAPTPPERAPEPEVEPGATEIIINGESQGSERLDGVSGLWGRLASFFGTLGSFTRLRTWIARRETSTPSDDVPHTGEAKAAGNTITLAKARGTESETFANLPYARQVRFNGRVEMLPSPRRATRARRRR